MLGHARSNPRLTLGCGVWGVGCGCNGVQVGRAFSALSVLRRRLQRAIVQCGELVSAMGRNRSYCLEAHQYSILAGTTGLQAVESTTFQLQCTEPGPVRDAMASEILATCSGCSLSPPMPDVAASDIHALRPFMAASRSVPPQ